MLAELYYTYKITGISLRSRENGIVRKIKKSEDVTWKRPNKIFLKEGRLEEIRRMDVPSKEKENTEKNHNS
jgi:hypothetical protein